MKKKKSSINEQMFKPRKFKTKENKTLSDEILSMLERDDEYRDVVKVGTLKLYMDKIKEEIEMLKKLKIDYTTSRKRELNNRLTKVIRIIDKWLGKEFKEK